MTKANPLQALVTAAEQAPAKKAKAPAKKVVVKKEVRVTKKSLAIEIMKRNKKADRQTIMGKFMSELKMSAAGANSYYYTIKAIVSN